MKFIIWFTFVWGIALIVLGIQGTLDYYMNPDPGQGFFDAGGPTRIITGSVDIMISMGLYRIDAAIYQIHKKGKSVDLHTFFSSGTHRTRIDIDEESESDQELPGTSID